MAATPTIRFCADDHGPSYVLRAIGRTDAHRLLAIAVLAAAAWSAAMYLLLRLSTPSRRDAVVFTLLAHVTAAAVFWLRDRRRPRTGVGDAARAPRARRLGAPGVAERGLVCRRVSTVALGHDVELDVRHRRSVCERDA